MNPFTIRTGRPGGPRLGDILEDGAGNRALVIDEPGTMDPGMVDRRYIVSVDDPENFTFAGDVRIVGNIANNRQEPAMSTPTPVDYGAYDRAIERAEYVTTKEEFEAACRADTYTETHTVGGLSGSRRAPKIEVGQVWEDCDGRMGMVTTLPYTVGPDVRFVFMVLTVRIETPWDVPGSGQRQSAGEYGVIFDGNHNVVKANGCKLIAGPGAPWPKP